MNHAEKGGCFAPNLKISVSLSLLILALVLCPSNANSQATGSWSTQFGEGMGLSGDAYALITDENGNLYAGGSFDTAGGTPAQNIAMWDGAEWHALGDGFNLEVFALTLGANGDLYAGGRFTSSGESPMEYLARWDGSEWHPIATEVQQTSSPGSGPSIHALASDETTGTLYVGGNFTEIDGVEAEGIASWDGQTWAGVGPGFQGGSCLDIALDNVYDIEVISSDEIYIVGNMLESDGVSLGGVALWNGSAWEALSTGIELICNAIYAVEKLDTDLYVAGSFDEIGGVAAEGIASWNGSSWRAVEGSDGTVPTGSALSLTSIGSDLYVGGFVLTLGDFGRVGIVRWSGTDWFKLGMGLNESSVVHALAPYQNQLWVGGESISSAGGHPSVGIARWEAALADRRESFQEPRHHALAIEALYPNPTRGTLNLTLTGMTASLSPPVIQVFDVLGRLVDEVKVTTDELDERTVQWQPHGLPSGQYIITLSVGGQSVSRQLVYSQ